MPGRDRGVLDHEIVARRSAEPVEPKVEINNLVVETWRLDEQFGHFPTVGALISTLRGLVHKIQGSFAKVGHILTLKSTRPPAALFFTGRTQGSSPNQGGSHA